MMNKLKFSCLFFLAGVVLSITTMAQSAKIYEKNISLKTYPFSDPNPVPEINRIYPYFYFHGYTNRGETKDWKMVVLENDYIQVFVCPAVGGKIWGAIEKSTGKEFIYFNHVAKFRDVAMRGAWTSGGLEYNFGDIGHLPTCSTPVDYTTKNNPDGSVSCVVGSEDLPSGTRWNVEIVVYPDKAFFETKVSWHNNTELPCTYYHWMNAAAKSSGNLEFIYPGNKRIGHGGEIGEWPVENGRDISFYENNNFGSYKSYHVLNSYSDFFGGYWHNDDFGFGHWANYDDKPGKKLWIWGLAPEGMIWKDLLTDTDGQYIEFQAGKLFNQAANSSTFTPFKHREFSPFDADLMDEIWFPLKGTKGMVAASKSGVLNIESTNGKNHLILSALQNIDAELKVISKGEIIRKENIKLKPLELFETDFLTNSDFTIELGDHLLDYSSKKEDILVNRPVEPNQAFDYTTAYGLHIKALEMEKQRRYNEAMDTYEKALEKEPAYAPSLNRMAMGFLRKGNAEKALEYLQKSLANDTYDDEANYIYGLANHKLGRPQEAKSGFSVAAASAKYRVASYTGLAKIFLNEKNYPKAREYALKSTDFNAHNLAAYEILALAARKAGDEAAAKAFRQKLTEIDAINPFRRFEDYLSDRSAEKLTAFNSGITNELPHETYISLALRYRELGCVDEAIQVLQQSPQTPEVLLWLASLSAPGQNGYLKKAMEASPAMVFPFRLETAEMIEKLLPENNQWKLHYYLGLTYWNLGLMDKVKQQFNDCGNLPDFAPFYLAKAKLFSNDKEITRQCLEKARLLEPADWRAALAQIRFDLGNRNADKARLLSSEFLKKYPEKGEMGMCYAQALIQLKKYKEAVAFLEKFEVLPYEGATIGRNVYHEACMRAAMDAIASKKYTEAIKYAEKGKLWPINLGVGQSYDLDERMDNFLIAFALEKQGKKEMAAKYFSQVAGFQNPSGSEENSKLLLQLLVLQKNNENRKATDLLNSFTAKYPGNKYLKWVEANYVHSDQAPVIEQEILKLSDVMLPYDVVFVDKEFRLMADFLKSIQ